MRVNLVQAICTAGSSNGVRYIQKEYDTEIKPCVGDFITGDSLWTDPYEYKVNYVEIDLGENYCRVVLDDFIVSRADQISEVQDLAMHYHGWKKGGALFG